MQPLCVALPPQHPQQREGGEKGSKDMGCVPVLGRILMLVILILVFISRCRLNV